MEKPPQGVSDVRLLRPQSNPSLQQTINYFDGRQEPIPVNPFALYENLRQNVLAYLMPPTMYEPYDLKPTPILPSAVDHKLHMHLRK